MSLSMARAKNWNFGFLSVPCSFLSLLDVLSFLFFFINEKAHSHFRTTTNFFLSVVIFHVCTYICLHVYMCVCANKHRAHSLMLVSSPVTLHFITEVKFLSEPRTLQSVQSACLCLTGTLTVDALSHLTWVPGIWTSVLNLCSMCCIHSYFLSLSCFLKLSYGGEWPQFQIT